MVMFVHRPEMYGMTETEEGESTEGMAEIIIGKQRNGPVDTVRLQFIKQYARFENYAAFGSPEAFAALPNDPMDLQPF
jgi:replicative DNA helicase